MTPRAPILVTGGSGQVGGALASLARRRGFAVAAPERAEFDLRSPAMMRSFVEGRAWTAIINCAAYTAVDRAEIDAEIARAINADAPALLADIAAAQDIPFIQVSTDYVFDGSKPTPYTETDAIAPLGVYGTTKAAGEAAVRQAAPHRHAIVRTAWVLSADGENFLNTMLRLGAERDVLRVVMDQVGCPTSAADLAHVLLAIVERGAATGQTWHVTNDGATSWHGLAAHIFARAANAGLKTPKLEAITTSEYPTPARRPANSRLATTRLQRDLNLTLRPWQEAVNAILDERLSMRETQ